MNWGGALLAIIGALMVIVGFRGTQYKFLPVPTGTHLAQESVRVPTPITTTSGVP